MLGHAAAAVALAALATPAPARAAQGPDPLLKLPALAERIARTHAQAGQGVVSQRGRRGAAEAMREFDAALKAALATTLPADARENYVLLAMLWQDYREWAHRAPSRETARRLRDRTEEVVHVATRGVRMLGEAPRGRWSAQAVRASQAALAAQRIAKAYLWRRWDIRDEGLDRELREARESLPRLLETLAASPGLPAEHIAHVEVARAQWRFLADAATQLEAPGADSRALEFACKAADHILESLLPLMKD